MGECAHFLRVHHNAFAMKDHIRLSQSTSHTIGLAAPELQAAPEAESSDSQRSSSKLD